MQDVNDER